MFISASVGKEPLLASAYWLNSETQRRHSASVRTVMRSSTSGSGSTSV